MAQIGEDCHFFMTGTCTKGDACAFRHCSAAKDNPNSAVCQYWLNGACGRLSCSYRHPSLPKAPPAAARAFAMGPAQVFQQMQQMMAGVGTAGCKYYLAGNCRNGANCPFGHGFAPQAPFEQPAQQHVEHRKANKKEKRQRKAREEAAPPPVDETPEQKRERLLSQPLPAVRSKKVVQPTEARVTSKKREEPPTEAPAAPKAIQPKKLKAEVEQPPKSPAKPAAAKPVAAKPAAAVPAAAAKPAAAVPAAKASSSSGGSSDAVKVKSLSQIMAEKASAPAAAKKSALDADLLALGIAPVKGSSGGSGGSGGGAKEIDAELLAMGLDPADL